MPGKLSNKSSLPVRLTEAVASSYHKTTLLQKRVRELIRGQRPLYETRESNPIAVALEEMRRGLIELVDDREERF